VKSSTKSTGNPLLPADHPEPQTSKVSTPLGKVEIPFCHDFIQLFNLPVG